MKYPTAVIIFVAIFAQTFALKLKSATKTDTEPEVFTPVEATVDDGKWLLGGVSLPGTISENYAKNKAETFTFTNGWAMLICEAFGPEGGKWLSAAFPLLAEAMRTGTSAVSEDLARDDPWVTGIRLSFSRGLEDAFGQIQSLLVEQLGPIKGGVNVQIAFYLKGEMYIGRMGNTMGTVRAVWIDNSTTGPQVRTIPLRYDYTLKSSAWDWCRGMQHPDAEFEGNARTEKGVVGTEEKCRPVRLSIKTADVRHWIKGMRNVKASLGVLIMGTQGFFDKMDELQRLDSLKEEVEEKKKEGKEGWFEYLKSGVKDIAETFEEVYKRGWLLEISTQGKKSFWYGWAMDLWKSGGLSKDQEMAPAKALYEVFQPEFKDGEFSATPQRLANAKSVKALVEAEGLEGSMGGNVDVGQLMADIFQQYNPAYEGPEVPPFAYTVAIAQGLAQDEMFEIQGPTA
uniref:Uncharacterized protein n=1 Tax=Chromera velia CCMP2878 TaxID=1169474 RepID=A0A0G4GAC9_9ALVE|eukprot:Cvel_20898.t1-p1 / transcript=Cvel_20898.t1 / gene=Cvel_20898 / organism=Chromera_velia_CCMP2878 / gene_product=hypothetical protein / transcript_product=hypothetical protein / location=Cvel_scaffold1916:24563-27388(-) / protein_length=454 / sequence_SO=supercontig / SO=protein_coding / is_pseudo=false